MNTIRIGGTEKALEDASESWINHQVRQRREEGPVCVQVNLKFNNVQMVLSTPECSGCAGRGGRQPNPRESEVFQLWEQRHLNQNEWEVGNLIAFLKQVRKMM